MGGIDLYLRAGNRRYQIRDAARLVAGVRRTPVVDGGGIKGSWEKYLIEDYLPREAGVSFRGRKVLLVSSVDRYGMAEAFTQAGAETVFGDFYFALGLPIPMRRLGTVRLLAACMLPVLTKLPFQMLYPTGSKQERTTPKYTHLFRWADVIAGDFHFIRRYMPDDLAGEDDLHADDHGGRPRRARAARRGHADHRRARHGRPLVRDERARGDRGGALRADERHAHPGRDRPVDAARGVPAARGAPRGAGLVSDAIGRFAIIIHPQSVSDYTKKFPFTRLLPAAFVERAFTMVPPFEASHITGIVSATGARAEGWFIGLPWTPRVLLAMPPEVTTRRLVQAGRIAERLGAGIVGLAAFTKVVGDRGRLGRAGAHDRRDHGQQPDGGHRGRGRRARGVPDGRVDRRRAGRRGRRHGSIGAACSQMLARQAGELVLVARNRERLERLAERLRATAVGPVSVTSDLRAAVRSADVVITVSSAIDVLIEPEDLRPGTVVCDVARPRNVSRLVYERRRDVLVIDGGVIDVPGPVQFGLDFGFPPGSCEACMAETILLALEHRYDDYTLGADVDLAKVEEIHGLMRTHGFRLSGLRRFERRISDDEVEEIRRAARGAPAPPARAAAVPERL